MTTQSFDSVLKNNHLTYADVQQVEMPDNTGGTWKIVCKNGKVISGDTNLVFFGISSSKATVLWGKK